MKNRKTIHAFGWLGKKLVIGKVLGVESGMAAIRIIKPNNLRGFKVIGETGEFEIAHHVPGVGFFPVASNN